MKIRHYLSALIVLGMLAVFLPVSAQTLADRARELRKEKRTPSSNERVYTNETLSLRAAPPMSEASGDAKKNVKKPGEAAAEEGEDKGPTPEEEKAKLAADFKTNIEKAKGELTQLQRELDVAQREGRLKAAVFYADAGTKLRDEKKYGEDERKNQADMADKQKRIADLQANLEKMRDGARRAGIPAGLIP